MWLATGRVFTPAWCVNAGKSTRCRVKPARRPSWPAWRTLHGFRHAVAELRSGAALVSCPGGHAWPNWAREAHLPLQRNPMPCEAPGTIPRRFVRLALRAVGAGRAAALVLNPRVLVWPAAVMARVLLRAVVPATRAPARSHKPRPSLRPTEPSHEDCASHCRCGVPGAAAPSAPGDARPAQTAVTLIANPHRPLRAASLIGDPAASRGLACRVWRQCWAAWCRRLEKPDLMAFGAARVVPIAASTQGHARAGQAWLRARQTPDTPAVRRRTPCRHRLLGVYCVPETSVLDRTASCSSAHVHDAESFSKRASSRADEVEPAVADAGLMRRSKPGAKARRRTALPVCQTKAGPSRAPRLASTCANRSRTVCAQGRSGQLATDALRRLRALPPSVRPATRAGGAPRRSAAGGSRRVVLSGVRTRTEHFEPENQTP